MAIRAEDVEILFNPNDVKKEKTSVIEEAKKLPPKSFTKDRTYIMLSEGAFYSLGTNTILVPSEYARANVEAEKLLYIPEYVLAGTTNRANYIAGYERERSTGKYVKGQVVHIKDTVKSTKTIQIGGMTIVANIQLRVNDVDVFTNLAVYPTLDSEQTKNNCAMQLLTGYKISQDGKTLLCHTYIKDYTKKTAVYRYTEMSDSTITDMALPGLYLPVGKGKMIKLPIGMNNVEYDVEDTKGNHADRQVFFCGITGIMFTPNPLSYNTVAAFKRINNRNLTVTDMPTKEQLQNRWQMPQVGL